MLDAKTGKHRSTVNIEKAAKVTACEDRMRFIKFKQTGPARSHAGETERRPLMAQSGHFETEFRSPLSETRESRKIN